MPLWMHFCMEGTPFGFVGGQPKLPTLPLLSPRFQQRIKLPTAKSREAPKKGGGRTNWGAP